MNLVTKENKFVVIDGIYKGTVFSLSDETLSDNGIDMTVLFDIMCLNHTIIGDELFKEFFAGFEKELSDILVKSINYLVDVYETRTV